VIQIEKFAENHSANGGKFLDHHTSAQALEAGAIAGAVCTSTGHNQGPVDWYFG
jgi:hypothetical protein